MIRPDTSISARLFPSPTGTGRGAGRWALVAAVALAAYLAGPTIARAQEEDPVIQELDDRVMDFFLQTAKFGPTAADALEDLLEGSPLKAKSAEAEIAALAEETDGLGERYGAFRSAERVAAKQIGKDLVVMKYLYKCEHFPVVWYFTFYRATPRTDRGTETSSPWRVIIVRFDTELELLAFGSDE